MHTVQPPTSEHVAQPGSDRAAVEAALKGLIERQEFDKLLQTVLRLFDRLSKENDALRQEVRSLKRKLYDRSSEKGEKQEEPNSPDTPDTPDTTDGVNAPESTTPKVEETPKDKTGHGRGKKPNNLPIVSVLVELTPGQRICPDCQSEMEDVRSGDAWQIEFIPGRFVVEDLILQRAGCPNCRSEFAQVNVPKVIPGSPVGPGLLARVLTDKAEDHLPLDRQQKRMEREGYFVAKTTLANWWRQGADLLMPLQTLLLKNAMSAFMPQIDATGLQVYQSTTKKTGDHHLWCVVGNDAVSFQYASKKTETLAEMLAHRSSITLTRLCPVQSDGDTSFSAALKKIKQAMVMIQCNMHARRKFFEALKNGDDRADFAIAIYGAIYGIERECNEQNLTDEQRTVQRMTRTLPELEKLREWSQALLKSGTVLKTTPNPSASAGGEYRVSRGSAKAIPDDPSPDRVPKLAPMV